MKNGEPQYNLVEPPKFFGLVKVSYAFCSTERPAFVFYSDGKFFAHVLNVGDPTGVSGYNASLYGWASFWGTSWSAPFYAAMQVEVNEACDRNMWGIPVLYGAFAQANPYLHDFYDVTSGNDDPGDGQRDVHDRRGPSDRRRHPRASG